MLTSLACDKHLPPRQLTHKTQPALHNITIVYDDGDNADDMYIEIDLAQLSLSAVLKY